MANRKVLSGHFLDEREIADVAHDVVITEDFAQRYFPGQSALNHVIHLPGLKDDPKFPMKDDAFVIVGVVDELPNFVNASEKYPGIFSPLHPSTLCPDVDRIDRATSGEPAEPGTRGGVLDQ